MSESLLTFEQNSIISQIESCFNSSEYSKARAIAEETFDKTIGTPIFFKALLACKIIDLGSRLSDENLILKGMNYIFFNRHELNLDPSNYNYNMGNAKYELYKIKRRSNSKRFSFENIEGLVDAKNHYWKAYQVAVKRKRPVDFELLVNLGNCLMACGRVVEALFYFDKALKSDPNCYMALIGRSEALEWLRKLSGHFTVKLINEIVRGYQAGYSNAEESSVRQSLGMTLRAFSSMLKMHEDKQDKDDAIHTEIEYRSHSKERQFHIDQKLTLNVHSLYCPCKESKIDSITTLEKLKIPEISQRSLAGEHWLNRFKNEFGLARKLYFQAQSGNTESKEFELINHLSVLVQGELTSLKYEQLRLSFRTCIGILDKIAESICEMLALPNLDKIYFESFWRHDSRWRIISSLGSLPLMALYSQATDLNRKEGQWSFFKTWRNALEHGNLVIIDNLEAKDGLSIFSGRKVTVVSSIDFEVATNHLLQFTRSAIFNFSFCINSELRSGKE